MAKIPTYTSQLGLTKEVPAVRSNPAAMGMEYEAIGRVGEVMSAFGVQMQKIRTAEQSDKAKIIANDLSNQADLEAQQEPYSDQYGTNNKKRIDSIKKAAMADIKDPLAQKEVDGWLNMHLSDLDFKFKQYEYKKLIDNQKDTFDTLIYQDKEKYKTENNPIKKQGIIDSIASSLNRKVQLGIISKNDALTSYDNIKISLARDQAEYDILQNPEGVLTELNKENFGIYSGIDLDAKTDLIKLAEANIKKNERDSKALIDKTKNNNESDIIQRYINKDSSLTISSVKDDMNSGKINPKFAMSLIKSMTSDKVAKTNFDAYGDIISMISSSVEDESIKDTDIRQKLIDYHGEGKLSDEDFKKLLFTKQPDRNSSIFEGYLKEGKSGQESSWIKQAHDITKKFIGNNRNMLFTTLGLSPMGLLHSIINKTIDKVMKGDNPAEISNITNKSIEETVSENNPDRNRYKVGDTITNKKGMVGTIVGFREDGKPLIEIGRKQAE